MSQNFQFEPFDADQYRNASNLNARIALHRRFSTNPYGWFHWVFDQLELPPTSHVLEIGSGPGDLWSENARRLPPGWNLLFSDLSVGMLEEARARLGRQVQFDF